jgi:putative DNA primase/helicase
MTSSFDHGLEGAKTFERCTAQSPCPICHKPDWCQVIRGTTVQCTRVQEGSFKTIRQSDGTEAHLHRHPDAPEKFDASAATPPSERAAPEILDAVYRDLLGRLPLPASSPRRQGLRVRGFSDEQIDAFGYRDYPSGKPWNLARAIEKSFGPVVLAVPGFRMASGDRGRYLTLPNSPGFTVPVRDRFGRIRALKLRRDVARPGESPRGGKYRYFTSKYDGVWAGPSAWHGVHVPLGTDLTGDRLRITEGPLKADLCSTRDAVPTVAMPSCGAWKLAVNFLEDLPHVREIQIALDADFRTNPNVHHGLSDLMTAIVASGRVVRIETWDGRVANGIDDAVLANLERRLIEADEVLGGNARSVGRRNENRSESAVVVSITTANVDANVPPGERRENDAAEEARAINDPSHLARLFLSRRHRDPQGRLRLRYFEQEWYCWGGSAWAAIGLDDVKAEVWNFVEGVFVEDHAREVADWSPGSRQRVPPKVKKLSTALLANVLSALMAQTLVGGEATPPVWLGRPPCPVEDSIFAINGTVHVASLLEGRYRVHPPTPELFNLFALPLEVTADAPEPREWLRFLDGLWGGDRESLETLQEWFGYCLTPRTDFQKALLMVGPGRAGKGTIARVLTELVGEQNVAAPSLHSLSERFGLSALVGKSLAIVGDAVLSRRSDAQAIAAVLKGVIGEDRQTVDRKNREAITRRLRVRLVISSNELPHWEDASGVVATRMVVLRLTESHLGGEDSGLIDRLLGELPGIVRWSVEGLARLNRRGRFVQPGSAAEAVDQMARLASPARDFGDEECVFEADARAGIPELYRRWRNWCHRNGLQPISSAQAFGRDMLAAYPRLKRVRVRVGSKQVWHYVGVRVRGPHDRDSPPEDRDSDSRLDEPDRGSGGAE